ncbi:hypothetical protein ANCCAN_05701 [Ancylostoma caninum]|uniref:SCP domain-containing protein n=1 Tax=Ancylostoma caninum TaxID=29170 RepID=A0A368GV86_ANCCA|nr:hypothetical protein ANCCAN_05701 [Ancylostoma caninum]
MFTAGLLFVVLYNFAAVSASIRGNCKPSGGTFTHPEKLLDPLVEGVQKRVPSHPSYDCEKERAAYTKIVLDEEEMRNEYPGVTFTKDLTYKTEKEGHSAANPVELIDEALQSWSKDLQEIQATTFGCNIDSDESEKTTTYTIGCLFN